MKKEFKKLASVLGNLTPSHVARMNKFYTTTVEIAQINVDFRASMKVLRAKLEELQTKREQAISKGMSVDEAVAKFSTLEVDKSIKALTLKRQEDLKPLNVIMSGKNRTSESGVKVRDLGLYDMVPDVMYPAYEKYVTQGKSGDFRKAIRQWMYAVAGVECQEGGKEVNKALELFTARIGAKKAKADDIVNGGSLTSAMKERAFKDIFLSVWCDILRECDIIA